MKKHLLKQNTCTAVVGEGTYGLLFFLFFVVAVLAGCSNNHETEEIRERVYATVNGVPLTETGLRDMVPSDFYDRLTPEHKRKIIEEWVNRELLFQEALNRKIDDDPDIKQLLYKSRRNLLSNELLERELSEVKIPTEAELRLYYDNNKEYFEVSTREYRIRYALFDNTGDATTFMTKVRKNESFSTLAEEFSKHPSSLNGGDLGLVNEESVEPQVWEAIQSTVEKRGLRKVSDPFRVVDGWGCIIVDDVFEPGNIKPFENVRDLVLDMYLAEEREKAEQVLVKQLTTTADVQYFFP